MYNYRYVTKNEAKPYKERIEELLHLLQNKLRDDDFTFQFTPVGSSNQNMITCLQDGNVGFDLDYNIEPNVDEENSDPAYIRSTLFEVLRTYYREFGYTHIENSTSVITLKIVDTYRSKVLHSCDIAIVHNYYERGTERQEYIRFNKNQKTYSWVERGKGFYLKEKIEWLKKNEHWNELRDYYIYKKNSNTDPDKHSRSLRAESVNEVYHRYTHK